MYLHSHGSQTINKASIQHAKMYRSVFRMFDDSKEVMMAVAKPKKGR